jgi:site-specific DNA-cytosine methylase
MDSFVVVDVWAGVSSFMDGFCHSGFNKQQLFGFIEISRVACALLTLVYPLACVCGDFYSYSWRAWAPKLRQKRVIVCGGPSCCHLSSAGKMLAANDPRAAQMMDTAKLAVSFGAIILILENVCALQDSDSTHGLLSSAVLYLAEHRMISVCCFRIRDSATGGYSCRERVFPYFEHAEMASCLPALSPSVPYIQSRPLWQILDPVSAVKLLVLPGSFSPAALQPVLDRFPQTAGQASVIYRRVFDIGATVVWRRGARSGKTWKVIAKKNAFFQVFYDSRRYPVFKWVHRDQLAKAQVVAFVYDVTSVYGVSRTIRAAAFPPVNSLLVYDPRPGVRAVRSISAAEAWRICSLSEEKLGALVASGASEKEIIERAGNSIPLTMTKAVCGIVSQRISTFLEIELARGHGRFTPFDDLPMLHIARLQAVLLMCVAVGDDGCLLMGSLDAKLRSVPGSVLETDQASALSLGARWATELGALDAHVVSGIAELPHGGSKCFLVICPQEKPLPGLAYSKPDAWLQSGLASAMAIASHFVTTQRVSAKTGPQSAWLLGRVQGDTACQALNVTPASSTEWQSAVKQCQNAELDLQCKLRSDGGEYAAYLEGWAAAVTPLDPTDVPEELHQVPSKSFWKGKPAPLLLFSDPHVPDVSDWSPLPAPHTLPPRPAPLGWLSGIVPEKRQTAADLVDAFVQQHSYWLNGKSSRRPNAVIIPESWIEWWAVEHPHEFYSTPGFAIPIDMSTPSPSHLDLDFLGQLLEGYPDQDLASDIILGVRYKADLRAQVVIQPHLLSFLPVQEKYLAEADRFVDRGWTILHDGIPCLPWRSMQCGSVERTLEPGRPRVTSNASAPHNGVLDSDGFEVVPINIAIQQDLLPKEVKPTTAMIMTAMTILLEVAYILGETVFVMADDFKSYFNQLRLAPSEYHKTGMIHPPRVKAGRTRFATDTVLGFGIKMASNVAQRFGTFLVNCMRHIIDLEEQN